MSQHSSDQYGTSQHTGNQHEDWLATVKKIYDQHKGTGGFQVLFPEYRPDLSRALANHLGLVFFDYRETIMQPLGWEAGNIALDDLTQTLRTKSEQKGLVVHNVEALLATKTEEERVQWLTDFVSVEWKNPVVLPLSIYQAEVPKGQSRTCAIEEFPKQSFLLRMAM